MCRVDINYNYAFGVLETTMAEGDKIPPPELIRKPIEFIHKLIDGASFLSLSIETEAQILTFFPSKKLAEDFLDEICKQTLYQG